MSLALSARGVTVDAGSTRILNGVDLDLFTGEVVAIVGPNGAGKSTLLKALSGDLNLVSGSIALNGKALNEWSPVERARQRAVLPQSPDLAFSFRTWDVVELGRHPHMKRATRDEDDRAIRGAMQITDVAQFAARECSTLSGGEAHRAHFARALAQIWSDDSDGHARVLLLDEPTSSLDLFHQHTILARARDFARAGAAILVVLHDLNLAATYADKIVVLSKGQVDAIGTPEDVITMQRVSRIWRVPCEVSYDPRSGRPRLLVVPDDASGDASDSKPAPQDIRKAG